MANHTRGMGLPCRVDAAWNRASLFLTSLSYGTLYGSCRTALARTSRYEVRLLGCHFVSQPNTVPRLVKLLLAPDDRRLLRSFQPCNILITWILCWSGTNAYLIVDWLQPVARSARCHPLRSPTPCLIGSLTTAQRECQRRCAVHDRASSAHFDRQALLGRGRSIPAAADAHKRR